MTTKSLIKVEITNEISELNKYLYRNITYTNKNCEKDICHDGDSASLNR